MAKCYTIYIPNMRKIGVKRDIIFDETKFYKTNLVETTFTLEDLSPLFLIPLIYNIEDEEEFSMIPRTQQQLEQGKSPSNSHPTIIDNHSNSNEDPYHFDGQIPTHLRKNNFMFYHSLLDNIDKWPMLDAFNYFDS